MRTSFAACALVGLAVAWQTASYAAPASAGSQAQSPAPRAGTAAPRQTAPPRPSAAPSRTLAPLTYVCPMPGDEDVMSDKPGDCPKCRMTLVPIRLEAKWWCPVHQANEVHDGPGKCRRDGRDLVQVTLSEYWTCSSDPTTHLLEPGTCAGGEARKINYELRAHGDHNPRHGGQFYMASDAWHHVEGTYPEPGLFRVWFYDNFTKPLASRGFTGTLVVRDARDKELATIPLVRGRSTTALEAKVPAALATTPLNVTLRMTFSKTLVNQPFDFQFNGVTKDTGIVAAQAAVARAATAAATTPAKTAAPAAAPTASAAPQNSNLQAQQPPQPGSVGSLGDILASEIAPMPPALAEALDESILPKTVPGLLEELGTRLAVIDGLMREGNISEVWLPAMGTKTVALVLEQHASQVPERLRAQVSNAARAVVVAAWEIDGYGDLGNKPKVVDAYNHLSAAVAELKAVYAGVQ